MFSQSSGTLLGRIADDIQVPFGLASDSRGNVYVTMQNFTNTYVYAKRRDAAQADHVRLGHALRRGGRRQRLGVRRSERLHDRSRRVSEGDVESVLHDRGPELLGGIQRLRRRDGQRVRRRHARHRRWRGCRVQPRIARAGHQLGAGRPRLAVQFEHGPQRQSARRRLRGERHRRLSAGRKVAVETDRGKQRRLHRAEQGQKQHLGPRLHRRRVRRPEHQRRDLSRRIARDDHHRDGTERRIDRRGPDAAARP